MNKREFLKLALASDKDFTSRPPPLVPFADWDYYYTCGPLDWEPSSAGVVEFDVHVPIGFVTDLASIPQIFWNILPPAALYTFPAILHDFLYWIQSCSRDTADKVLQFAMKDMGVSSATALTIYEAVRIGGGSAWSSNAKARATGEKRVLKSYPNNLKTTWAQWKLQPQVFTLL